VLTDVSADGDAAKQKLPEGFDLKAKVIEILEKNEFLEKRSSKLDIDDFLRLLSLFNQEGIHFA
jgi:18S rRNA (adenine1779-N6/adenine1780-N6)-dimethyltransferase